jgi:hypothetical protein
VRTTWLDCGLALFGGQKNRCCHFHVPKESSCVSATFWCRLVEEEKDLGLRLEHFHLFLECEEDLAGCFLFCSGLEADVECMLQKAPVLRADIVFAGHWIMQLPIDLVKRGAEVASTAESNPLPDFANKWILHLKFNILSFILNQAYSHWGFPDRTETLIQPLNVLENPGNMRCSVYAPGLGSITQPINTFHREKMQHMSASILIPVEEWSNHVSLLT